jgi:Uma2 family endonuclease/DNA-binding transcriptional regulator YdaS (Cro superfamily)
MANDALRKAIANAGSQTALAAKIGKTQGHVSKWLERDALPAEMVLAVEKATGIPRYELRPDIYPDENFVSGFSDTPQTPYYSGGLRAQDLLAQKPIWTVAELDALQEEGRLEQERWELLEGIITPMQSKGMWHEPLKAALTQFWVRKLPDDYCVITETTFRFTEDTFLEPDFTFYPKSTGWRGLSGGNVPFVVEVADTSKYYDLGRKAKLYAKFGIRELWVIEARTQKTHIHLLPSDDGYNQITMHENDSEIAPQFCKELGLKLNDLELY